EPGAPGSAERRGEPTVTVLTHAEGRALLDEVGVAYPACAVVTSAGDATRAAHAIGGTVVLKVQAAGLLHKTDVGGVALHVRPDDAADAYDALVARVRASAPGVAIEGVLVQQQVDPGVE